MIIVPVEKKFDWRHAPVILFLIVIVNIFVFFLYQSGDNDKIYEALEIYQNQDLLEEDWPRYETWLEQQNKTELLEEYRELYEYGAHDDLTARILFDQDFQQWLESQPAAKPKNIDEYLDDSFEENNRARNQALSLVSSISAFNHGLVANNFSVFALISHQFLHGDMMHLLGNLFFLVICGFAVEAALGHLRFLLFYIIGGIGAGMAQVAMDWNSSTPLVGASGAISGVMAMYLGVFRFKKIEFFYWLFILVGYFRAPALLILPFYIGMELYQFFSDPDSNVAFMAHAGGFVSGTVLMLGSLLINPKMLNEEYIEEDQSVDPKLEKLAKVYTALENFSFKTANEHLNELIKEHGLNFEHAVLRLNIFSLVRSKNIKKCVLEIFRLKQFDSSELPKLEKLWRNYIDIGNSLDDEEKIRLAIKMSELPNPQASQAIFTSLKKQACVHEDMKILEIKLRHSPTSKN